MTEKFALVTGGSRNIGASICKRLCQDGINVISVDIIEPDHQYLTAHYETDLSNASHSTKTFDAINKKYDIQYLINNVGLVSPTALEEETLNNFNKVIQTNTSSALLALQSVFPTMKKLEFGRVVSISSRVHLGKPLRTSYSASKGALVSLTRTWALELGKYGITFNCVAPGPIGTSEFWKNNPKNDPFTKSIIKNIPLQRIGTPEDVAHAVSYFLDDRSSFVTGQTMYVCGGVTVGLSHN